MTKDKYGPAGRDGERDRAAYQRFVSAARGYWAREVFTTLLDQVERDIPAWSAVRATAAGFRARVEEHPTHQVFAWMERHLQRMRYSGPYGLVAGVEARRDALGRVLDDPLPPGLLSLDPDLRPPAYYAEWDIHQHPGGLGGDSLAAFVYQDAVGGGVVGKPALHERFAQAVLAACNPKRVLDLGCGFGRSSVAFGRAAPGAHVHGIDLSASCVSLAAHDAPPALRPRLSFVQADALASGLPDAGFDLVTSTMLLHEMPEDAVRALIRETGRLTAEGGMVAHLDFLPPADPLPAMLYAGHARRNNEPYLLEHSRIDLAQAYREAGFECVEVTDFAEEAGALSNPPRAWRLPWKMIVARKPVGAGAQGRPR